MSAVNGQQHVGPIHSGAKELGNLTTSDMLRPGQSIGNSADRLYSSVRAIFLGQDAPLQMELGANSLFQTCPRLEEYEDN